MTEKAGIEHMLEDEPGRAFASFLPQYNLAPLPSLAGNTFSRSLKIYPPIGTNHPIIPTVRKMSTAAINTENYASIHTKTSRSSISGIPRPVSGTSRHATPSIRSGSGQSSIEGRPSERPSYTRRDSWQLNDGAPPSSFKMTQRALTSSKSQPPYDPQGRTDLSGIRQQLDIKELSTNNLRSLDEVLSPQQSSTIPSMPSLPKSRTLTSILSSKRDLTPRRLLQPLPPPMPRSQTLGNISCFSPAALTPSPRKAQPAATERYQSYNGSNTRLDIVHALAESRMTDKEMAVMQQVQREAAINRIRMRNTYSTSSATQLLGSRHSSTQSVPFSENKAKTSPITPAGSRRIWDLKRDEPSNTSMVINTDLANRYASGGEPRTPSSVLSSSPSEADEDWSDVKQVRVAESTAYWTGRFMAASDHLRMQDTNIGTNTRASASSAAASDSQLDSRERIRINAALTELRKSCATLKALKSFEAFETEITKRFGIKRQHFQRSDSQELAKLVGKKTPLSATLMRDGQSMNARSSPDSSSTTSRMSSTNAQTNLNAGSTYFYGPGGIAKSKTTGNQSSMIPLMQKSVAIVKHVRKLSTTDNPFQKPSYTEQSPDGVSSALKGREDRAARRVAEVRKLSEPQSASQAGLKRSMAREPSQISLPTPSSLGKGRPSTIKAKFDASEQRLKDSSHKMPKDGHGSSPSVLPITPARVRQVSTHDESREKAGKSRRKSERQISGELVKNFFGAGVREVRKMSRRVGSGIMGSNEEFMFSPHK